MRVRMYMKAGVCGVVVVAALACPARGAVASTVEKDGTLREPVAARPAGEPDAAKPAKPAGNGPGAGPGTGPVSGPVPGPGSDGSATAPEKPKEKDKDASGAVEPPAAAYPHPMITEVLFSVPTGEGGDANQDGTRDATGDEFVELINPHARPINLRGYILTDGGSGRNQLRFVFPAMELPPGGVVVVFNGHGAKMAPPVGDAKAAPEKTNAKFHGSAVFTMRSTGARKGFSNAGDACILRGPNQAGLQRVRWGKAAESAGGTGFVIDEVAPGVNGASVQRTGVGASGSWQSHLELDSRACSPGEASGGAKK